MSKFLNLTVSGAVSGAVYSLIACGLVLSYSATGIFNFAYGGVAFSTAFVYYELNSGLNWSVAASALVAILVYAPLLGLLLEVSVFRPLARASATSKIVATVGLAVALPAATRWVVERMVTVLDWSLPLGDRVYVIPSLGPSPRKNWNLPADITVNSDQVVVFGVAIVSAVGLWFLLRRTRTGLTMRAYVDRPDLAEMRGVNSRRLSRLIWILGMVLAGTAGVVGAPIFNSLDADTYTVVMFVAIAAAVLGGLKSVLLAFVGGLVLGIAQNLVAGYATFANSIAGFNAAVPFLLLLAGLVVLGVRRERAAGSVAEGGVAVDYLSDLPRWRTALPWCLATVALCVYVLVLADDFWVGIVLKGLAFALIFMSFVIVTGYGGLVSLAQAAFATASALTAGMLIDQGVGFVPAMAAGIGVAVLLGMVVAVPALRLGGVPFALATLALAFLGERVLFAWDAFRNGQQGWSIPRPSLGVIDLGDDRAMAAALLLLILLVSWLIRNLSRSSTGRAMAAVRSSEVAAGTSGLSPITTKLKVFAVSAALAGMGGVLLGSVNGGVTSSSTPATIGLLWLATVVLFGIRRPGGAVIAGLVAAISPQLINDGWHFPEPFGVLSWDGTTSTFLAPLLFGLGAIQLAREPDGALAIVGRGRYKKRRAKRDEQSALATLAEREEQEIAAEVSDRARALADARIVRAGDAPTGRGPDVVLAVEDLCVGYDSTPVLRNVDIALHAGHITAIVGANGSGKSTLCSTIAGLIPPTDGTITLQHIDVTALRADQRAKAGIVVAPESRGVFPGLSVQENLEVWLRRREQIDEVYERFPVLGARRPQLASSLSGGEQQMLALAPLVVRQPIVLVADEPTLGLAPRVVTDLLAMFTALKEQGTTILLAEERTRDVLAIADDVVILELGQVVWAGPHANLDEDRLVAAYLGADVTGGRS